MTEENNDKSNKIEEIEDLENIKVEELPITTGMIKLPLIGNLLQIFLHIISLMMPSVFILTFYSFALGHHLINWRILFIFVDIFSWWGSYILVSLLFGKLILIILKLLHKPREGIFKANFQDKDYYYFCLRTSVKKFIFWVWNNFAFPWVTNFAFKLCDMTADFKSTLFDGWSDVEFIEYGESIMLGQGALVMSTMIIGDSFLIKRVIVGDHVVIGGMAIVSPGTIIGKNCTLGVWAVTHINQVLEPDWIYIGNPAVKYQPAQQYSEENKKIKIRRIVDTNERIPFEIKE
ncbi:MAG: hypothetical protein P8Y70_08820 [Candidatus Lokiarchaeota archaeon]